MTGVGLHILFPNSQEIVISSQHMTTYPLTVVTVHCRFFRAIDLSVVINVMIDHR